MNTTPLPAIRLLPALPTARRAQVLDTLFEPCTQLHTLSVATLHDNTYPDYPSLIAAIRDQLTSLLNSSSTSDRDWLDAILCAHPRLGKKRIESELSKDEQAGLRDGGGEEEGESLEQLNREYEKTFPGIRYVTFVNGGSRHLLMEDMRRRIERGDLKQERHDAIQAMCDIALDRVNRLGEEVEV